MEQDAKVRKSSGIWSNRSDRRKETRPLTTDERASFMILALYMATFCITTFVYFDLLALRILGVTAAAAGIFLFLASFFTAEPPGESTSIHPFRSYLLSFFYVLFTLFVLRLIGGLISNFMLAVGFTYLGLILALIFFRKHMLQVLSTLAALVFLFVTFLNFDEVMARRMNVKDVVRQCGQAIFRIGPIQDVANMLLAGSYVTYLKRIDYRDTQLNAVAVKKVARLKDDEWLKTETLLNFVSRDIHYVSDPDDGLEYAKDPIDTLIAGAGDCEDQALLLCTLLESVGLKTYMAFSDEHVLVLVRFARNYPDAGHAPYGYIDGDPCYALDPSDPAAEIGTSIEQPARIKRVFDSRDRLLVEFTLEREG